MKLKANLVGGEGTTGEARPFDRALALFVPLFARAVLVVEGEDILGAARHVCDDESDARVKFARMPFDLGEHATRLRPVSGLLGSWHGTAAHGLMGDRSGASADSRCAPARRGSPEDGSHI